MNRFYFRPKPLDFNTTGIGKQPENSVSLFVALAMMQQSDPAAYLPCISYYTLTDTSIRLVIWEVNIHLAPIARITKRQSGRPLTEARILCHPGKNPIQL
jgi:hypothetical protein